MPPSIQTTTQSSFGDTKSRADRMGNKKKQHEAIKRSIKPKQSGPNLHKDITKYMKDHEDDDFE